LIGCQGGGTFHRLGLEPEVKNIAPGPGLDRQSALGKPLPDPATQEEKLQGVGFRRMLYKRAHAVWFSKCTG
jgi:hypothetical protein